MKLETPYSKTNSNFKKAEVFNLLNGTIGIYSAPRPDEEGRINQDSCAIIPINDKKCLLVVADGVGGSRAGDLASKLAIESMVQQFAASPNTSYDALEVERIIAGHELANQAIRGLGLGAGTTLVCSEINHDYVRFYNTGDSVAQLLGGKGVLKYRTLEQSASGYAIESQMVEQSAAQSHADSNMLMACLGDPILRLEVSSKIPINMRDLVVMGSDGLWANVSQELIQQSVTSGTIEERLNRLIELSYQGMKAQNGNSDDLTIILYSFGRSDGHLYSAEQK